ncbi:MAG: type II toxin-antitoxin system PemK/MazF family toxin [Myxococcaceae bacterium]|nr:type II toxin-antitoxin system PemK/MazF family toxin [Myxococcaceae bacterium]
MKQYEVWWADLPAPVGRRPVLLLSRDQVYRLLRHATVAEITTTIRNIPVEVELGVDEGLDRDSVANLDNIQSVALRRLSEKIGALSPERAWDVERAIGYALDIDRLKD